jgi:hypothetical protein
MRRQLHPELQLPLLRALNAVAAAPNSYVLVCSERSIQARRLAKCCRCPFQLDEGGRSTLYQGVDLDGDGRADTLLQGCGSPSDGSCVLYVTTSSGHKYEFDGRPFYVGVFERQYYIIEGNSSPRKPRQRDRNIYLLTETSAKRVCNSI